MSRRSSVGRRDSIPLDAMIESNVRTSGERYARDECMSIGLEVIIVAEPDIPWLWTIEVCLVYLFSIPATLKIISPKFV
jgi:hypothetical protein